MKKKEIVAWMAFSGGYPAVFMSPYSSIPAEYKVGKTKKSVSAWYKPVKVKIMVIE